MSTSHPPFDHRAGHDAPEHEKRVERRDEGRERGARVATMLDIAVLIGALLVALAVALVLQTQLELGWELSVVAGLAVFAIAASLHILLQRTEEIGRLKAQIGAMEQELGTLRAMPQSVQGHPMPRRRGAGEVFPPAQPVSLPQGPSHSHSETAGHYPAQQRVPMPQGPTAQRMPQRMPWPDASASGGVFPAPDRSPGQPHAASHDAPDNGWLQPPEGTRSMPSTRADMRSPLVDPTRRASAHRDTQDPEAVVDAGPNEGYEAAVPPNAQATGAQATGAQAREAQAREAQAGTAQVAAPPARTESRPQPVSEPLPQFMTPSNEATKTAKKGGLFAGLTGRLGRSAKTSDAKTPAAKTSEATAPSVNAGARQRVVNGWQGGGPALQRPAGADPAQAHNAHAPDHQAHDASAGGARGPSIVHQPAHEPMGYGQPNETPNVRRAPSRPEAEAAHPSHRPAAEQPARDQTAAPHLDKRPEPTIPMPPPAPILSDAEPSSSYPLETNPVDSLIQSIANRLAAEREGVSTEELLALPAPYLEDEASTEGEQTQTEPLSTEAGAMARSVRAAVEAGRVEVHLQPILSLDGLATVSYEAFPRLKDEAGAIIKPSDYLSFAHRAGLNSGIEKLALLKAIHVLQQLDARGKLSPIFINVSQELLADGHFFSTFIEAMKGTRNLSHNLVLEFAQPIAAAFDERDLESLDTLSRLGFTFALDDVDHVEMDFEPLISRGLSFVKVSADVFRHGLIAGEALIPTDEIRLLFEDAGLQVIVHHISTEEGLDAALAQNVIFGQGNLFAEPKPIRAGVLAEAGKAA